jgi:hypothetical protein
MALSWEGGTVTDRLAVIEYRLTVLESLLSPQIEALRAETEKSAAAAQEAYAKAVAAQDEAAAKKAEEDMRAAAAAADARVAAYLRSVLGQDQTAGRAARGSS